MIGPGIAKISDSELLRSPATLQVDVIADLVCPWSYLGKRRLDDALAAVHGPSIVMWYPFQLNPNMPAEGMSLEEYLASKFGDPETLAPGLAELKRAGKAEGIDFNFDRISRVPNTLGAHRLMKFAERQDINASQMAEEILKSFFEHGHDISDLDVLIRIGAGFGISANETRLFLEDERSKSLVLAQENQVRQSGVTGVPDFLVNKRLFVVGAHSTESLVNVFDRAMFGEESDLEVSLTLH